MVSKETQKLIEALYQAFVCSRPELVVDNPNHCLACDETQEAHETLFDLKKVTANDFRLCYMSIEALNEKGLYYYLPRLMDLVLHKAEITKGFECNFVSMVLEQLIPNTFGNRFEGYSKSQVKLMIGCLEEVHTLFYREEYAYWDYEFEVMLEHDEYKENVQHCEKALIFWKNKL